VTHLFDFPWPAIPNNLASPVWTGSGFRVGHEDVALLSYEPSQSGWTDELTVFHEDTAGSDHPIDRASRELALAGLQLAAPDEPVVLEIGCSSGYMLMLARERTPKTRWIGSDYVRGPLEKLAVSLPGVPLLHFDLRHCPLPDNSVDAVLMLNVLEHIDDDALAMHHVQRILRPGGVAVIEVPAGPGLYDAYDEVLMHHRRYTAAGLRKLIRGSGLQVAQFTHLGALVFPAFYVVKQWNKRRVSRQLAMQRSVVASQIRSTRSSRMMTTLLAVELALGRHLAWPFGIRCVAVGRKTGAPAKA